jgi:hypothetical protein
MPPLCLCTPRGYQRQTEPTSAVPLPGAGAVAVKARFDGTHNTPGRYPYHVPFRTPGTCMVMLGGVVNPAVDTSVATLGLRRLAMLIAIVFAVVAVRGPMCTEGGSPPAPNAASETVMPNMPPPCPVPAPPGGGLTAEHEPCPEASPTTPASLAGLVTLAGVRVAGQASAPSTPPRSLVAAVLRHAATLHQLGLLRT